MRNLFLFFVLSTLAFAACKKDDALPEPVFSAAINGTLEKLEPVRYAVEFVQGQLRIYPKDFNTDTYFRLTANGQAVGTYPTGADHFSYFFIQKFAVGSGPTYTGDATNGSVEITEINTQARTVSGRFSGKAGGLDITDGVFTNLPYTGSPEVPVGSEVTFRENNGPLRLCRMYTLETTSDFLRFSFNSMQTLSSTLLLRVDAAGPGEYALDPNLGPTPPGINVLQYNRQQDGNSANYLPAPGSKLVITEFEGGTGRIAGQIDCPMVKFQGVGPDTVQLAVAFRLRGQRP